MPLYHQKERADVCHCKMKLGIDSYCYHRFFGEVYPGQNDPGVIWRLGDFIDQLPKFQPECLSLETCFLPSDEDDLVRALSRIKVDFMFAWGHPDGFMRRSEAEVQAEIEKYLALSAHFGCSVLRIAGSSIAFFSQPHSPQIELTLRRLDKLLPVARKYGVKLAIENHGDFYSHELQEILVRADSPSLGITLDTGNHLRLREDPTQSVEIFGEKVFVVHAKDVAPMEDFAPDDPRRLACVPAGKGITDFRSVFAALKTARFDGMVLIEISRIHPDYEWQSETAMIQEGFGYLTGLREEMRDDTPS